MSVVADMQTHFDRLGLPRRFALDGAAVERQYLARSRAVHPDYHDELNKQGFSITNPQAKSTCGCGSSFSM